MADRVSFSAGTLSAAARGDRFPTRDVVMAFAEACGEDPAEWSRKWKQANRCRCPNTTSTPIDQFGAGMGLHFVDTKDWHLLESCMTVDAHTRIEPGILTENIIGFRMTDEREPDFKRPDGVVSISGSPEEIARLIAALETVYATWRAKYVQLPTTHTRP
ncbi:helix-turn-helix transcriptional regulator [Allokutzneria sp. A3M-2-11 16]|nr:helix-turn-helix transcriptional regulator [Allokutzneria sp. A3M-2-11 16]